MQAAPSRLPPRPAAPSPSTQVHGGTGSRTRCGTQLPCRGRPHLTVGAPPGLQVEGNVSGVLSGIDAAVTSDAASVKDLADAALALAGLQATGDRR
jgi:hypothetical protein